MTIINRLSSMQGDKTEESNKNVAGLCIENPGLLNDIAFGLESTDKKLQSDCIEVFTIVSERNPDFIIPFTDKIIPLLRSKETKIRWETAHTLSFIACKVPDIIHKNTTLLLKIIETDKSTIVRDYAITTIGNYAGSEKKYSEKSYEILIKALALWGDKHAKQVLKGLSVIIDACPEKKKEILKVIKPFLTSKKTTVVTEAKKIIKQIEKLDK